MPATTPVLHLPYPTADDSVDVPRDVQALAEAVETHGALIVGEVRFIAVVATPGGWLPCDGAAVSRTTYAKLYAAIANRFGPGDGSATFNVPDLRDRAPVGVGPTHAVGTKFGEAAHTLLAAESGVNGNGRSGGPDTVSHTHNAALASIFNLAAGTEVRAVDSGFGLSTADVNGGGLASHTHGMAARNADAAHNNEQPSLAVPAYIYAGA